MVTSGEATGGNDVFSGKARCFWWLLSQNYLAGPHGQSTILWAWTVNWAPGDGCHWIRSHTFNGNGNIRSQLADNTHPFNGGHSHNGDWPAVNGGSGGGFASGTYILEHDASGAAQAQVSIQYQDSSGVGSFAITGVDSLPNIPQTVASPSGASASRINDGQASVTWTNNSTGTAPYANINVYRQTDGGGFALIATLGVVTSYTDTTISANHRYVYRVSAVGQNTVEVGYSTTSAIWTTPGTPTSLVAAKIAGGNIRLTWTNNVNYSDYTVRIEESQNGGAYSEITNVSAGTTTWDHVTPNPAVTHKYRIRARTNSGTTLNSSYSNESATIVLLSTANPPTTVNPSGVTVDASEIIVFTWTHNPADGTPQSKYQLQYKIGAGAFVTVGPTNSSVSSYSMPASTVTNGQTITWHVATAGENGTLSAYSSDAVFTTQNRPTSTISSPTSVYTTSHLTTTWTYFQTQGSAQASWHAYLWRKGALADYSDATLLEEAAGAGTTSSYTFNATLLEGFTYAVRVFVTSATGLISSTAGTQRLEFDVAYLPPADATLSAVYDPNYGRMIITVVGSAATPNVQGLSLDGAGDWGSTADAAALDITGDIDLRADIRPVDWTPLGGTAIIEKWSGTNQRSYALVLLTDGKIRLRISTDGTAAGILDATSSVAIGAENNARLSIRAARVGATVTFYTSTDTNLSTAVWTPLGVTQTLTGTIFVGTSPLLLGADSQGVSMVGIIFSAQVRNSAGTVVAHPVYTTKAPGTTSFSDGLGNTWTMIGVGGGIVTIIFGTEAIATVDLQRRINGGVEGHWVTWAVGIVLPPADLTSSIIDTAPTIKGTNEYRAIVRSAIPSSRATSAISNVTAEPLWGFLSTGPGFAQVVRMRARLNTLAQVGRAKNTYHFAGRALPVELSGEETNAAFSVNAVLYPPSMGGMSSEPEELEALALTEDVVLWRDYTGRRIFASLSPVQIGYETQANKFPVGFNLTQTDYDENVG